MTGALWGGFSTTGQRCTASSRLVVDSRVADEVVERLVDGMSSLVVGDGLDPETNVGPLINAKQLERVHSYTGIGVEEGADLVVGGEKMDESHGGYFYTPPRSSTMPHRTCGSLKRRSSDRLSQ